jgi:hypothetical protein
MGKKERNPCQERKKGSDRVDIDKQTRYSPDVLERLPYWVRELLKMAEAAEAEKAKGALS